MRSDSARSVGVAFDDIQPWDSASAEKNLMYAILRMALEDLKKGGDNLRDAKNYLLSEEENYLFSFKSVCQQLNLCPITVRFMVGINQNSNIADEKLAA